MRTRAGTRSSRKGATLLEMVIASSLLAIFGGTVLLVSNTATRTFRTESLSAELDSAARQTLSRIATLLRSADAGAVNPQGVEVPDSTPSVDFRRGIGFAADEVQWGDPERLVFEYDEGDPDDGVDNDGDGLVDEGRVVYVQNPLLPGERRVVLCNWVSESLEGELPGNLVDDNGNQLVDETGFCVVFDGNRAIVRLTLARRDAYGTLIVRTLEKSIALRNTQNP